MPKRILSVGHCAADHYGIALAIKTHFDAEVIPADSAAEAKAKLQQETYDLVLVNRVFDADGSSGLGLIADLKANPQWQYLPVMLVSNYDNYQREAVEAGAVLGFGKAALGQPQMLDRLRPILGFQEPQTK